MPRTCGQQVAPTVLSETLFALPTTLSRMTPQRGLAAGTARQRDVLHREVSSGPSCRGGHILFSQEKDAKVIQGERPLDIPLIGARCFPASMGGDFSPNPGG